MYGDSQGCKDPRFIKSSGFRRRFRGIHAPYPFGYRRIAGFGNKLINQSYQDNAEEKGQDSENLTPLFTVGLPENGFSFGEDFNEGYIDHDPR